MKTIIFTPNEAKVLNHRLEVPDCIAERYGPDNENRWGLDLENTESRVCELLGAIFTDLPGGRLQAQFDPADPDQIEMMNEVIDGNFYPNFMQELLAFDYREPEYREGCKWRKAMRGIDAKYEAAGLEMEFGV